MTDSQTPIALAFPHFKEGEPHNVYHPGLTKREYFAAMAMMGAIACPAEGDVSKPDMARFAISMADVLIAELAK